MKRVVYACHIGIPMSERRNFCWVRMDLDQEPDAMGSNDPDELVNRLVEDLLDGFCIALGFGAPLYMPCALSYLEFGKGRDGDGNRSIFSPVESYAAMWGCQESAFVLSSISGYHLSHDLTLAAASWCTGDRPQILVWESSVQGAARVARGDRVRDAATAAAYFHAHQENLERVNAATCDFPFSLIGAAALSSGWRDDPAILGETCLVLRPDAPYEGPIWIFE